MMGKVGVAAGRQERQGHVHVQVPVHSLLQDGTWDNSGSIRFSSPLASIHSSRSSPAGTPAKQGRTLRASDLVVCSEKAPLLHVLGYMHSRERRRTASATDMYPLQTAARCEHVPAYPRFRPHSARRHRIFPPGGCIIGADFQQPARMSSAVVSVVEGPGYRYLCTDHHPLAVGRPRGAVAGRWARQQLR